MTKAFKLDTTPIEEVAQKLGELYHAAAIAKDPMFGWVQIINDVTILGEELRRRNREKEAAARAGKVLMRLLEFVGYYLYIHSDTGKSELADLLSKELRMSSYKELFDSGPREGPTRWILAKFPYACSKCAQKPCHCSVEPWILEERRQNPQPYEKFRTDSAKARKALATLGSVNLTLRGMFDMFKGLYRNNYYNSEPWKVGMHLSEEMGEATIELSRLDLAWRGHTRFDLAFALDKIIEDSKEKISNDVAALKARGDSEAALDQRLESMSATLDKLRENFKSGDPWNVFRSLVTERFKEEVADVFSWLSAIIVMLDPGYEIVEKERQRFVNPAGTGDTLKCPWCGQAQCSDNCLVSHGVISEITEKLWKY